jgi:aspartyl-tRNA(Asn)/glutamyl-tRNA(Gln) amidotransferase subunit B
MKVQYQPIIGLEIHIELKTKTKMFCDCLNDPNEKHPNFNICPICLGQPGTLPVINKEAVKKVIKTGLVLNCEISEYSKFDRKNYFYPDLPKGYQISQYDLPLGKNGFLEIEGKKIRITRIHLEEDTGKLIHPEGADYSLVDFNRAGMPLMELVTEPDIESPQEARKFAQELQLILRYLGVSNADMEKGEMRIEANVSLQSTDYRPLTTDEKKQTDKKTVDSSQLTGSDLGVKVEIKNLNSFWILEKALEYEIERQKEILKSGKKIIQETRGWNEKKEVTVSQREKEEAHDYRYFPEPDLPLLHITPQMINDIQAEIPELPQQRRERFLKEYQLSEKEIEIFVQNKKLGEYFEKVISELREWIKETKMKEKVGKKEFLKLVNLATNYLISDLLGLLKKAGISEEKFLITPENFAELISLIYEEKISSRVAKEVLQEMFATGADPSQIIEEKGLWQISEEKELEKVVKKIISENKKAVEDFKKGKEKSFQFLIGQIMKETKGKANPQMINKILKKNLKN